MLVVEENSMAIQYESEMIASIQKNTTQTVIRTPNISGAMLDGFFVKNNVVTSCFELKYWRYNEKNEARLKLGLWFLDDTKIEAMRNSSKYFGVPSYLFGGFDKSIYIFILCDKKGSVCFPLYPKEITMPKTTMGSCQTLVKRHISEFEISNAVKKIYLL